MLAEVGSFSNELEMDLPAELSKRNRSSYFRRSLYMLGYLIELAKIKKVDTIWFSVGASHVLDIKYIIESKKFDIEVDEYISKGRKGARAGQLEKGGGGSVLRTGLYSYFLGATSFLTTYIPLALVLRKNNPTFDSIAKVFYYTIVVPRVVAGFWTIVFKSFSEPVYY